MNYFCWVLLCLFFMHNIQAAESEKPVCSICHSELYDGEQSTTALPCFFNHIFHTPCINRWQQQSQMCPLCCKKMPKNKDLQLIASLRDQLAIANSSLEQADWSAQQTCHFQAAIQYLQHQRATLERKNRELDNELRIKRKEERRKNKRICSIDMALGGLLGGTTIFSISASALILHVYGYL